MAAHHCLVDRSVPVSFSTIFCATGANSSDVGNATSNPTEKPLAQRIKNPFSKPPLTTEMMNDIKKLMAKAMIDAKRKGANFLFSFMRNAHW